jgi:small subunit ribosomal protein S15Ae
MQCNCLFYVELAIGQWSGYIGEFELVDDHRAGKIVVELNGRLNKCGVISPRYDVGVGELEAWTARLLPSRQVTCTTRKLYIRV